LAISSEDIRRRET